MTLGLFYIGKHRLSLEGFTRFIQPVIETAGYQVHALAELNDPEKGPLIAISGDGDLVNGLTNALDKAVKECDKHNASLGEHSDDYAPISLFVRECSLVASYPNSDKADELFKSYVLNYQADRTEKKISDAEKKARTLEIKIGDLEKRLKKLAKTSLSDI